jgi:hypothetical protein
MSHPDKVPTSSPSTSRPAPARRRIEKGIRQIRPGVYEVQAFVGRDPITGRMRQVSETTAGGIARAREVRPKLIAKVQNGEHGSPKGPATPSALLDEWLEHNRGILRWAEPVLRPISAHGTDLSSISARLISSRSGNDSGAPGMLRSPSVGGGQQHRSS